MLPRINFSTLITIWLLALSGAVTLRAQQREVTDNNQVWLGYMTSTRLNDNYSIWNDFHYVPEGFLVLRTGLTRHYKHTAITAGYGHLWLPLSQANPALKRNEQRPWAQVQFNLPISERYSLLQRVRYDGRFRQDVKDGELTNGYSFTNRLRFLMSVKRTIGDTEGKKTIPYVTMSDEVLLNFGKDISWNTFDQNRISLMLGIQRGNIQVQSGYMNRFVQTGPARFTQNHMFVVWVFHKFKVETGKARVQRQEIMHN